MVPWSGDLIKKDMDVSGLNWRVERFELGAQKADVLAVMKTFRLR